MQRKLNNLTNSLMAGQFAGFSKVKFTKPQRSAFDLSHQKRLTMRMGQLVPVLCTECVPSDTFRGSSEILLRLAPLLAPIYDQIMLYVHFFFVPNRLLWEEWETFITGGRLGVGIDPVAAPIPPYFEIETGMTASAAQWTKGSLLDYLGCPDFVAMSPTPGDWADRTIDAMPAMAYQLIYTQYYTDRNYLADDYLEYPFASGEVSPALNPRLLGIQLRSYLHDYFTSALPFTQRGEEVLMPLAGTGSVTYLNTSRIFDSTGTPIDSGDPLLAGDASVPDNNLFISGTVDLPGRVENIDEVSLDSSSVSINDFRSAYALQVWLERNAVGGSRYTESTQAHFGVKPQDSRLQRPEYIGGGRINVQIREVVATAWSNDGADDVPQANMAGHGITYGNTNRFNYFCTEHGFIMGICSIMNPPSYQQGLPRMFQRKTFLDYPWPTFAKLGEQQVNDYEIYCTPESLTIDDSTGEFPLFGYQSRYADWKYMCTTNHGDFKDTLLFWTLTRVFDDAPQLGLSFVAFDDTTQNRIFAVGGAGHNFWLYVNNHVTVRRPLPYFGTPNTLGFGG